MYRLQTNLGYTDPLLYSLQSPVTPSAGDLPFSPTAVSPDENVAMPTPPSTPGQLGPPFSTAAPASDSIAAWSPTASTALPPIQTRREAAEAPLNGRTSAAPLNRLYPSPVSDDNVPRRLPSLASLNLKGVSKSTPSSRSTSPAPRQALAGSGSDSTSSRKHSSPLEMLRKLPAAATASLDHGLHEYLAVLCSNPHLTTLTGARIQLAVTPSEHNPNDGFRSHIFHIAAFEKGFTEHLIERARDKSISAKAVAVLHVFIGEHELVSRFNRAGQKLTFQGHPIWRVDAKRLEDGAMLFRSVLRSIIGEPVDESALNDGRPRVGERWSLALRIWDPRHSLSGATATFYPPLPLPSWLSFLPHRPNVLNGIPPTVEFTPFEIVVRAKLYLPSSHPERGPASSPVVTQPFVEEYEHRLILSVGPSGTETEEQPDAKMEED